MRLKSVQRLAAHAAIFALTAGTSGCDRKVNITNVLQPAPNFPPTIIAQGPDYPATPIELLAENPPSLYFLVVDRNGLDDISVALLSVDTVIVHRIIARPATTLTGCRALTFAENDTVALGLSFPRVLTGLKNCPLASDGSGYFRFSPFHLEGFPGQECRAFPGLDRLSPDFVPFTSGCTYGGAYYASFTFDPPTRSPVDIFITDVEVEYRGISVTVYDAAGESALVTFPKLRLVHTSREEQTTAP